MGFFSKGVDGIAGTAKNPLESAVGNMGIVNLTAVNVAASANVSGNRIQANGYYYSDGSPLPVGGNGAPGGGPGQVQFNNNDLFGGDPGFTYNKTTKALTVQGNAIVGNIIADHLVRSNVIVSTGNITGANLHAVTSISGVTLTASGNVNANNAVITNGINAAAVTATGNITGAYIFGNGSQLTGINTGGVTTFSGGITGLTPNIATAGNVTLGGTLAITNGGTGATTAANARTNLGLGSLATLNTVSLTANVTDTLPITNGGTGATSAGNARTNLGLGSLATLNTVSLTANVSGTLPVDNGGTGATTAPGARTSLGLGNIATLETVSLTANVSGTLPIANGGTGATSAGDARTNLGLGSLATSNTVSLTANVSGTLPVGNGGTGVTSTPANGQLLIGDGTGYSVSTLTAGTGVSITNGAGTITINATGTAGVSTFSGGTTGLTPNTPTTGAITLGGALAITNGGTGAITAPNARTNLGLGNIATLNTVSLTANVSGILPIANGGTGANTASSALSNMSYLPTGNGAVARSATVKMSDIVSVSDYGNRTQARDAAGVKPVIDINTGKIYFAQPANPTFDEAGNVLGRTFAFDNRGVTMVVPANKQYNYVTIRQQFSANPHNIGAGSQVAGYTYYLESTTASDTTSNMYGVIGVVQTAGAGTCKGMYSRAIQLPGCTGVAMAAVMAVDTATGGGDAYGIQMSMDTSTNGGNVAAYIWMSSNTSSVATTQFGILADTRLYVVQAFINYVPMGPGDFLKIQNTTQTDDLFKVKADGSVWLKPASASAKMIDLVNGAQINFTGTATTASSGSRTLPANPAQFITVLVNDTTYKIPVYNA